MNELLKEEIKTILEEKKREMADKDRDKLQTIDFLKKDMYEKTK